MGNKVPTVETKSGWKLTFDIGTAELICSETHLKMVAEASNFEDLEKIKAALVKHLIKFAAKLGELDIRWE